MPETMGGGVAVLDYDGDGKPDLLFVSGASWPGDARAASQKSSLALYRNEGNDASGLPRFRNVTREAGLERVFYGMGASVADYDNDGRDDVYVTALNRNFLFHNLGGRFEEVSSKAGVRESGWGTSSAWLDYDGDGLLDLYVCRYVDWSPDKDLFCTLDGQDQVLLHARALPGRPVAPLPQPRRRPLRATSRSQGRTRQRQPEGARRRAVGLRRRRPGRPARRQRHGARTISSATAATGRSRTSAIPSGRRRGRGRPRARRHGRGVGRYEERPRAPPSRSATSPTS